MTQPPNRIYLQFYCGEHDPEYGDPEPGDVTWCAEQVFSDDVEYVRVKKQETGMSKKRKAPWTDFEGADIYENS